jgi:hypothetical protein
VKKYHIASRADDAGFDVHIVIGNGVHQTVLGFVTEPEAHTRIAQGQVLSHAVDPFGVRAERDGKS